MKEHDHFKLFIIQKKINLFNGLNIYMHDTLIYNCKLCSQVYDFGVLTAFNNGNSLRFKNNNLPLFIAVPSMFWLHILYRSLQTQWLGAKYKDI